MSTDKDKLFDEVVVAFHQSTGNLPQEQDIAEIEKLVAQYEDEDK